MSDLIAFALLLTVIWLWWDSSRARECAVMAAARACGRDGVQFLDQSVALRRLRLARDGRGRMRIARLYTFDFSPDGSLRRPGFVVVMAGRVRELQLDHDSDSGLGGKLH